MAAYTMKSDKIFLRCLDMGGIEVYEVDSPYIYPVKGKHWSHLGISIGSAKKYEVLQIGNKQIKDADLQTLIKYLFNSRLIVNREGLCFLASTGVTAVLLEVDYYRLFDLFDWSKYEVKTSLNTRWARSDFVSGRPLDIVGSTKSNEELNEKQAEVDRLKEELGEARRKKEEELKEKQNEIDRLMEELADVKRKIEIDLSKKQNEVDAEKKKMVELEKEVKLHVFHRSGLTKTVDFFGRIVQKLQSTIPFSKMSISPVNGFKDGLTQTVCVGVPLVPIASIEPIPEIEILCQKLQYKAEDDFDLNNWRILKVGYSTGTTKPDGFTIAYYDGNKFQKTAFNGWIKYPIPCHEDRLKYYFQFEVNFIVGLGSRLIFIRGI